MKSGVLRVLRSRFAAWLALRIVLFFVATLGAVSLGAILLDAAFDLSDSTRLVAPCMLAICGLAVFILGSLQWRRSTESYLAHLFEKTDASLGNRLINAVQLSHQSSNTPVEECLRRDAVELGRQAAVRVALWPAVRRPVKLALGAAGTGLLAWLCFLLLGGEILQTVWPRFLDPHGDHPPYSTLHIDILPGRTEVLYGGQVEVRARTSGRPADQLWLVAKSGTNFSRALMFLAPDRTFFQTLANLRAETQYYVTDGRARSRFFPIGILYTPEIRLVEVTTTFPDYTGKRPRTGRLTEEIQALPEETHISFKLASNRPLKSGRLTLTPVLGGKTAQITLRTDEQNDHVVTNGFTLTEPVVFSLTVTDVDNRECAQPIQGRFNVLPDERPRIFVLEPGRDAVATTSVSVPVRVQAEDDYGITRVVWLRGYNRSIDRPFNMRMDIKTGPQSVEAVGAFEFDKLGVRPGDVIEYYFEAADNYPKGPNVTLSRMYRVDIISKEQYEMILRQAAARKALFEPYFKLDQFLQRLAERARALEKEPDPQQRAKDAAALAEDLQRYENELSHLMQQAILFDIEQAFRDSLVQEHTRISQARKQLQAGVASGQLDPKALTDLAQKLNDLARTEQQDVGEPARQIAEVVRLLARADAFVKLAQRQEALAQLLRRFSDRKDALSRMEQVEMQELAHQQERVQQDLRQMLTELPELASRLPQEDQFEKLRADVSSFTNAVTESQVEQDLADATKAIGGQDGPKGYELALQAAEKLNQLIAKCNGGQMQQDGEQALRFRPTLTQALGNTLNQILAAMGNGQRPGQGQGGQDGYALFNEDAALYGPSMELAGEQAGGRNDNAARRTPGTSRLTAGSNEPGGKPPETAGRVRLQPDAKFPLRYRDLVGEYFRAIAESAAQGGDNK